MVSNFIMPNYVCAKADPGETLVSGFFYLQNNKVFLYCIKRVKDLLRCSPSP